MKRSSGFGRVLVRAQARGCVSMAGVQLLVETARVAGLDTALSQGLEPWRKDRAVHDPGKVILDLVLMLAAGGDCPADVAVLRCGTGLFGPVASDPTISRLIDTLAGDPGGLEALRGARAHARAVVAGLRTGCDGQDPDAAEPEVLVDIDATLITAHSEKQDAAPT